MLQAPLDVVRAELEANAPFLVEHPRLSFAGAATLGLAGAYAYRRWRRTQGLERADALASEVGSGGARRVCGWALETGIGVPGLVGLAS